MNPTSHNYDGGPAFPRSGMEIYAAGDVNGVPYHTSVSIVSPANGMTLRDWFAGQALVGLLSKQPVGLPLGSQVVTWMGEQRRMTTVYALLAVEIADALLAELRFAPGQREQYPEVVRQQPSNAGGAS